MRTQRTLPFPELAPVAVTEPLPNLRLVAPTEPPEPERGFEFITTHQVPVTREYAIPPQTAQIAVPYRRGADWYLRVFAGIAILIAIAVIVYTSR